MVATHMVATHKGLALMVALAFFGAVACGGPRPPSGSGGSSTAPSVKVAATLAGTTLVAQVAYPAVGIRLDVPQANLVPQISATTAYSTCASGESPCVGMTLPATAELAIFSDDQYGSSAGGTLKPAFQNVLAWVLTWHRVSCSPAGPAPRVGSGPAVSRSWACDQLVFVDATSGKYMLAWVHSL
jgi:hypothetical protein